jgi:hypothetical protein
MTDNDARIMHASMREVETGLFNAEYFGADDLKGGHPERFPDTHNSTDANALKTWVETMAVEMGFTSVVWDELPAQLIQR